MIEGPVKMSIIIFCGGFVCHHWESTTPSKDTINERVLPTRQSVLRFRGKMWRESAFLKSLFSPNSWPPAVVDLGGLWDLLMRLPCLMCWQQVERSL